MRLARYQMPPLTSTKDNPPPPPPSKKSFHLRCNNKKKRSNTFISKKIQQARFLERKVAPDAADGRFAKASGGWASASECEVASMPVDVCYCVLAFRGEHWTGVNFEAEGRSAHGGNKLRLPSFPCAWAKRMSAARSSPSVSTVLHRLSSQCLYLFGDSTTSTRSHLILHIVSVLHTGKKRQLWLCNGFLRPRI